jgi:alkylation response protein AidB-like acyl-CoA dehydrogenase
MISVLDTGFSLLPLILGGSPEQQKKYLQPFIACDGEPLCSLTHSEPDGTTNWLENGGKGLGVKARREGDFYIVNGKKVRRYSPFRELA